MQAERQKGRKGEREKRCARVCRRGEKSIEIEWFVQVQLCENVTGTRK